MNIKRLWVAGVILISQAGLAQKVVKLPELNLDNLWQKYGTVQVGKSVTGEPASVGGQEYPEAIGTQAESVLKIALKGMRCASAHGSVWPTHGWMWRILH